MIITVAIRNVFGSDLVYPADDNAALFATLIGAKTFSLRHLVLIKALGYTVHIAAGKLPTGWEL